MTKKMDDSIRKFELEIDKVVEAVGSTVDEVLAGVVEGLYSQIVETTPIDTARAKMSWLIGNRVTGGLIDKRKKTVPSDQKQQLWSTSEIEMRKQENIQKLKKGASKKGKWYVYSNLKYMPVLNDGRNGKQWSKQGWKFVEAAIIKQQSRLKEQITKSGKKFMGKYS